MGNPKQKWTSEEEEALKKGVAKHGTGKWKNIQRDPEFNPYLFARSNIDLKDKWRNMSVGTGTRSGGEKLRTSKPKSGSDSPSPTSAFSAVTTTAAAATTPSSLSSSQASNPVVLVKANTINDNSSKTVVDGKNGPKYNAMIFEAISASNEPNGADVNTIVSYIEQRLEVPRNFRRQLTARLRRLILQNKLEKVQNCYKVKSSASFGTKTPSPKQKDVRPGNLQSTGFTDYGDSVEEAAVAVAYRVAEAENKSFVAAEAVKEAERVSRMAEDTDSILKLAEEIFEKCSQGETVLIV